MQIPSGPNVFGWMTSYCILSCFGPKDEGDNMKFLNSTHIKVELFKGPVVSLGYVLPGSRDVCLRSEQSTKPDVQCL